MVVDQSQLNEMVRVLELFARYIANSWKRLKIMAEFQRTHDRQLTLDRKELAAILLSGELGDRDELRALARRAGLQRLPDRVLVLQIKHSGSGRGTHPQISEQMTLNRLSHVVEDFCLGWANTLAMVVRPGELCIFTSQDVRNPSHERISVHEMAEEILAAVRSHYGEAARIGISAVHGQPAELVHAYHEACAALDSGAAAVSFFNDPAPIAAEPVEVLEKLFKAIRQGTHMQAAMREFLAQAMPSDHSNTKLQQSRAFLTWAIEHLALETTGIGADALRVQAAKEQAVSGVLHAPSPFSACESFRRFAELLSRELASTFSQREHKIVLAVRHLVEEKGVAQLTIQDIAEALHLSAGHLSRVFRRTTSMTLEAFLIRQRVELAKRALLDPRLNVAEVAEKCGFCNPAYFASVFKKYVRCTPREFARQPHLWDSPAAQLLPADSPATRETLQ
jgi:AraC-like DNA-binding protein